MNNSKSGPSTWLKKLSFFLPPLLWAMLIFALSSQPQLPGPQEMILNFLIKKTAHITVFAVLFWLSLRAVRTHFNDSLKYSLIVFAICVAYAVSDEIHQSFVPNRSASLRDVWFDSLGIFIAWLKWYRYV